MPMPQPRSRTTSPGRTTAAIARAYAETRTSSETMARWSARSYTCELSRVLEQAQLLRLGEEVGDGAQRVLGGDLERALEALGDGLGLAGAVAPGREDGGGGLVEAVELAGLEVEPDLLVLDLPSNEPLRHLHPRAAGILPL